MSMDKYGTAPSDLRAMRELELRQIRTRMRDITLQHEKTAAESAELDELTERANALKEALQPDE